MSNSGYKYFLSGMNCYSGRIEAVAPKISFKGLKALIFFSTSYFHEES
jgi:hypothetical protein